MAKLFIMNQYGKFQEIGTCTYQGDVLAKSRDMKETNIITLDRYCGNYLLEMFKAGNVIFSLNLGSIDEAKALEIMSSLKF